MGPEPLVTIVTPSYNQGRFIRATIESVLSQDYPRIEYIIMDGGSTDETADVVREYHSRVTWISEKDRGQSDAINKGFRRARGEIVSWINSDDVLLPGAVRHAVEALQGNPAAAAVYGEGYCMDLDGRMTRRFPATEPFNLWKLVHLSDYVLQQTLYLRRSALDEVGLLEEDLHYGLDWDLLIRLGKRHPLVYIPEYMGCIREHAEAKSFAGGSQRIRELRRMLQRHTGMAWPPGWITYGLQAWQDAWRDRADHAEPKWLRGPAVLEFLVVYGISGYVIMRILRDAQGWYPDQWAGTRVRWMLPAGGGAITVRGSLPAVEALKGQRLRVFVNGELATEAALSLGDFELHVAGPADSAEPVHLELRASRYVRPPFGSEPSFRKMAYRLYGVDWAREGAGCRSVDAGSEVACKHKPGG
jgi:glycosyltransferase involved in cell wall biosynthesis